MGRVTITQGPGSVRAIKMTERDFHDVHRSVLALGNEKEGQRQSPSDW